MTITNTTCKVITLVNDKKIKPHETVNISNVQNGLMKQIEQLVKQGLVIATF